jgi:hypothetical protein
VLLPRPVAFLVPSDEATPYWVLDARRSAVFRAEAAPDDVASVITTPEALLADAIDKHVVNLLHISLRLRIDLRPGGVDTDLAFWGLLAMWELGYLPPWKLRSRRATGAAWRRRRELTELATQRLIGSGSFAERMTGGLIAAAPPTEP